MAQRANMNSIQDVTDLNNTKIYKTIVQLLRKVDMFKGGENKKGLRASDLDEIIQIMTIEKFKDGQKVFNIHDYGDKFFIVLSGEVAVLVQNESIKDWSDKYEQYQLLLKDIENRKIMDRKERLIKSREAELNGEILRPVPGRVLNHAASIQLSDNKASTRKNLKALPTLTIKGKKPRLSQSMTMQFDAEPKKKNDLPGSLATVTQELSEEDSQL